MKMPSGDTSGMVSIWARGKDGPNADRMASAIASRSNRVVASSGSLYRAASVFAVAAAIRRTVKRVSSNCSLATVDGTSTFRRRRPSGRLRSSHLSATHCALEVVGLTFRQQQLFAVVMMLARIRHEVARVTVAPEQDAGRTPRLASWRPSLRWPGLLSASRAEDAWASRPRVGVPEKRAGDHDPRVDHFWRAQVGLFWRAAKPGFGLHVGGVPGDV
jgi:hypothetical protein